MAATKSARKSNRDRTRELLATSGKLSAKAYERELAKLHAQLVKLQLWTVHKGLKTCVVFEGRDGAGKGGVIKAMTERVSPRVFRVVALPAPTEREKSQMYIQRYVEHLPAAGEIVIFDRSWYNRAGVERVMEFCSMDAVKRFLEVAPVFEKAVVEFWHRPHQILAGGQSGRAAAPARSAHQRPAQDMEAVADGFEVVRPLVRLLTRARRHVQSHRYALGALACRALRRQAARSAQHDLPSAYPNPL